MNTLYIENNVNQKLLSKAEPANINSYQIMFLNNNNNVFVTQKLRKYIFSAAIINRKQLRSIFRFIKVHYWDVFIADLVAVNSTNVCVKKPRLAVLQFHLCSCGSVVEHCITALKVVGLHKQIRQFVWMKASAKCIWAECERSRCETLVLNLHAYTVLQLHCI